MLVEGQTVFCFLQKTFSTILNNKTIQIKSANTLKKPFFQVTSSDDIQLSPTLSIKLKTWVQSSPFNTKQSINMLLTKVQRKINVNLKSLHLLLSDDIAHPSQSSSALHFLALGCSPTFYGQTDKLVCLSSHISSWRYAVVKRFLEKRRFFKVWSATLHHTGGVI